LNLLSVIFFGFFILKIHKFFATFWKNFDKIVKNCDNVALILITKQSFYAAKNL